MIEQFESRFEPELFGDETVLWVGQPSSMRQVWRRLPAGLIGIAFVLLVSIIFSGFTPGMMMPMAGPVASPFALFDLIKPIMLLVGFIMVAAPLWTSMV